MLRAPRSPLLRPVDLVEGTLHRSVAVLTWLGVPLSVAAGVHVWDDWTGSPGVLHLLAALLGAAVLQSVVVLLACVVRRGVDDVADAARARSWERALRTLG